MFRGVGDVMDAAVVLLFIFMVLAVIGLLAPVLSLIALVVSFLARLVSLVVCGILALARGGDRQ